mgnify:CR=1 FL=1
MYNLLPNTIYNFDEPVDRSRNFSAKYDEVMRHNFDEIIDRRASECKKYEPAYPKDVIPMWIADMDLKTAQPIMDAMEERNRQGIFGYTTRPAS